MRDTERGKGKRKLLIQSSKTAFFSVFSSWEVRYGLIQFRMSGVFFCDAFTRSLLLYILNSIHKQGGKHKAERPNLKSPKIFEKIQHFRFKLERSLLTAALRSDYVNYGDRLENVKRMRWQEDEHMRSVAVLAVQLPDVTEKCDIDLDKKIRTKQSQHQI